jgi:thiol-disulfide isomerase/thioredoxin
MAFGGLIRELRFAAGCLACTIGFALFGVGACPAAANDSAGSISVSTKAWKEFTVSNALDRVQYEGLTHGGAARKWPHYGVEYFRWIEGCRREVLRRGLDVWAQFPDAPGRENGLIVMLEQLPRFWADLEQGAAAFGDNHPELAVVDYALRIAWERKYQPMRASCLADDRVHPRDKRSIRQLELRELTGMEGIPREENLGRLYPFRTANLLWDFSLTLMDQSGLSVLNPVKNLLGTSSADEETYNAILKAFELHPHQELRWLAKGKRNIMQLRKNGFELQGTDLDGMSVATADYLGKVLVVDFWSNNCGVCVKEMPQIEQLLQTYRKDGLAVLGIWLGDNTIVGRNRALQLLRKQGASWKNLALVGTAQARICEDYAITGVPVRWILDRKGRLVTVATDQDSMEKTVAELLYADEPK